MSRELAKQIQRILISKGYNIGQSMDDGVIGELTMIAIRHEISKEHAKEDSSLVKKLTIQLRRDEGERLSAYQDHLGYWTIGIGRLIDERRNGGITKEESSYLLSNDIDKRISELLNAIPWMVDLDEARQGVLVNMAFQMGVSGLLGFKNTLSMIERGMYDEASNGMMNSKWAKQTPARAERLSKQMKTGIWQ